MPNALFLDFDGLVLDTETMDFESWRSIYVDHGVDLPRERWVSAIGTDGSSFRPHAHLCELTGRDLDSGTIQELRDARRRERARELQPLPGVEDWIAAARARGLPVAIVSSSSTSWVEEHLDRVGLREPFEFLMTSDHVERVKPHPDLYDRAMARLANETGSRAERAIVLEDSPHGVAAAKAAGLFCVAIPGPMTLGLDFSAADLVLGSLAERSFDSVFLEITE